MKVNEFDRMHNRRRLISDLGAQYRYPEVFGGDTNFRIDFFKYHESGRICHFVTFKYHKIYALIPMIFLLLAISAKNSEK